MGNWEVACDLNKEVFVIEEDVTICQVHGGLEERGLLANQICLMRNEGVELLKKMNEDLYAISTEMRGKRPIYELRDEIQDFLKRMGVDCE